MVRGNDALLIILPTGPAPVGRYQRQGVQQTRTHTYTHTQTHLLIKKEKDVPTWKLDTLLWG